MEETLFQDEEKVVQVSMNIIIESGDARNSVKNALDRISEFDFDGARNQMQEAHDHISKAHNSQTEMIQAEISGTSKFQPSLLFNHAQDTLMTVMSEINLTDKMITVFEKFYNQLNK